MSEQEILTVLDGLAESFEFPGFNNANYESADARMHLFRNADGKWALLVEELVDWMGADGPQTILFGTGPLMAQGASGLVTPFDSALEAEVDDDGLQGATLRDAPVDLAPLDALAEELEVEPSFALLVHLSQTARDAVFLRPSELSAYLAPGASHLLSITDWCHPNVYHGDKPSASEAFLQVAKVLHTGDLAAWAPTEAHNNRDWRMWQDTM
ncbi:MAG: hypothetical protein HOO96_11265 [Polyangiaceae bacterium]|nr:hypothetical protein [Polyangiaceae bacterium]